MSTSNTEDKGGLTYQDAGVDIGAGNALVEAIKPMARSTNRPGVAGGLGGFGGLFDLKAAGFSDPILVAANDGVGTKLKIAIETGVHDTVGIDLVAMCVNDLVVQGAQPLFFLDYVATGKLDVMQAAAVVEGIAEGCRQAGAALIGGETAEMPGLYQLGDYDLAGFAVGAAERGTLLPRGDVAEGDAIIGLASSGVHSNGFSLVRRVMELKGLAWDDPTPFDADTSLGQTFLEPTRIYVRPILSVMGDTGAIKALAHVTGGGLTENIPRVLPDHLCAEIDLSSVVVPPVFKWLADAGGIDQQEMLRTFNCGVGMAVIAAASDAERVRDAFAELGETATILGELKPRGPQAAVTYRGDLEIFV